jgi:hypothetical protein
VGLAALGALSVAGCGGNSAPSSPGSSTTTTQPQLDGLTADAVLAKVKTAAESAKSVHVTGDISQGAQSIKIDIKLAGVGKGAGTVLQNGGTIELVRLGNDLYFKADEKTLSATVAQGNPEVVKLIAGRYVKASVTTPGFDSFTGLLDFVEFVKGVLTPDGKVTRVDGTPAGGTPTVGLKSAGNGEEGGLLLVANSGEPYPLQITPGTGPGKVTMSEWNKDVTISAPPADQVIDVSKLGG